MGIILLFTSCMLFASDGIILDCTYSVINFWKINNLYSCSARILFIGDLRTVSDVTQNHLAPKTNSDVTGVAIRAQDIRLLPRNLNEFYPNLESYDFLSSKIQEISREDLKGFPKLKQLHLNDNQITSISPNTFDDNPLLIAVSFINNPILYVAHNVFDNLLNLYELRFDGARCLNQKALTRPAVVAMLFPVLIYCPPTFEMTEDKILDGTRFHSSMGELEKRIEELERLVALPPPLGKFD